MTLDLPGLRRVAASSRKPGIMHSASLRVADQASWSAAFFAMNAACSLGLSSASFAELTVCTSISFILIAVARGYAITGRCVAGAQSGAVPEDSLRRSVVCQAGLAAAAFAAAACVGWLLVGNNPAHIGVLAALSFSLVFMDGPRQFLIFSSRYGTALSLSIFYLATSGISCLLELKFSVLVLWVAISLLSALVGYAVMFRVRRPTRLTNDPPNWRSFSWRLSAEAVYVGLSSQIGLLLIYGLGDPHASEGLRLAYALVFAPAFMLLQAVSPLYFISASRRAVEGKSSTNLFFVWSGAFSVAIVMCAIGALILNQFVPSYRGLSAACEYLIPIGLSVLSSQVLELSFSNTRLRVKPGLMHRLRLVVTGVDLLTQISAVWFAGVVGLVVALVALSIAKIAVSFCCVYIFRFDHRRQEAAKF